MVEAQPRMRLRLAFAPRPPPVSTSFPRTPLKRLEFLAYLHASNLWHHSKVWFRKGMSHRVLDYEEFSRAVSSVSMVQHLPYTI